jgi:hypothetical protein
MSSTTLFTSRVQKWAIFKFRDQYFMSVADAKGDDAFCTIHPVTKEDLLACFVAADESPRAELPVGEYTCGWQKIMQFNDDEGKRAL